MGERGGGGGGHVFEGFVLGFFLSFWMIDFYLYFDGVWCSSSSLYWQ